jgi:hypothetical protein
VEVKNILLVLTLPRISEKIWPVIPVLSKFANVTVYCVGEMSRKMKWYGGTDPREHFARLYSPYCTIVDGPGLERFGQNIREEAASIDVKKYDLCIIADNRVVHDYGIHLIANKCHRAGMEVVGCPHGNQNFDKNHMPELGTCFDKMFLFGWQEYVYYSKYFDKRKLLLGGYPGNDGLRDKEKTDEYILVVPNFLGFRKSGTPHAALKLDKDFITKLELEDLQQRYGVPVMFKLRARFDEPTHHGKTWLEAEEYVKKACPKGLDVKVMTDCDDNNELVCKAKIIITCASTLALKAIHSKKPTMVIKGTGQMGNLKEYHSVVNLENQEVSMCCRLWDMFGYKQEPTERFLFNTLEGSLTYGATKIYAGAIYSML